MKTRRSDSVSSSSAPPTVAGPTDEPTSDDRSGLSDESTNRFYQTYGHGGYHETAKPLEPAIQVDGLYKKFSGRYNNAYLLNGLTMQKCFRNQV